ncbi:ribonuclease HII [Candidatus Kapabacteria bacterium]|nr:ribonuclease HII [Candidatus Kapabacteria bacterium]
MPNLEFEKIYWKKKLLVGGCDEAGRGPLAGPVFAACILLNPNDKYPDGIDDSKKLSHSKRSILFEKIKNSGLTFSISQKSNDYIDEHNILQSSIDAMNDAADSLATKPEFLLIDGNRFNSKYSFETIVKGDAKSITIAMASILAKVARDEFMIDLDKKYPEYNFKNNKGYPTKSHFKAISEYGITPFHRKTFLKKYYKRQISIFS